MTKYVLAIAVVAIVAAMLTPAQAAWDGDFIYASPERWSVTMADETGNKDYFRYSVAVAKVDMATPFFGGQACVGYDQSEPLAGNEGPLEAVSGSITYLSRGIVAYDADTALVLNAAKWGQSSTRMHIAQLEYRAGEAYEDNGSTSPGRMSVYGSPMPVADGGMLTGRLQLAVDARGYDKNGTLGINPRLDLSGSIGAASMTGADGVMGLAKDEVGNLYVAGRVRGSGDARVYKIPYTGGGGLQNADGQRVTDLFGAPGLLVQKVTPVSWFTGVAAGGGGVYVTDYNVQSVDVYDPGTGALKLSVDLSVANGVIPDVPALTPEDVRVDPTFAGPGVRLVVQVLDEAVTGPLGRVDLLVLDVDPVAGTLLAAKALCDGGGAENGHYTYTAVDWLEISPDGDIVSSDVRGNNDQRAHAYKAEAYATAMGLAGQIVPISNVVNSMWSNRSFDQAKGGAFVPEPASMALLALGGLALIRRRK